jgi:glutathione S-transferase
MQAKLLRHLVPTGRIAEIALASPGSFAPSLAKQGDVVIYTIPTSICSQRVRLALEEKGVAYRDQTISIPDLENLRPWYLQLNPRGLVPTITVGDESLFDSATIMRFVNNFFDGPSLAPRQPEQSIRMDEWIKRSDEFPVRDLSYRWQLQRAAEGMPNYWRPFMHENLLKARAIYPEYAELYERKLEEWADIERCVADPTHMQLQEQLAQKLADDADKVLSEQTYLVGDTYSLADVSLTPLFVRLQCGCGLSLWGMGRRPHLERYVEEVKRRPSYDPAILAPYRAIPHVNVIEGPCWLPNPPLVHKPAPEAQTA